MSKEKLLAEEVKELIREEENQTEVKKPEKVTKIKNEEKKKILLSERKRTTTSYVKNTLRVNDNELVCIIRELIQELMERDYKEYLKLVVFLETELFYNDDYSEEEKKFIIDRVYEEYMNAKECYIMSNLLTEIVEKVKEEVESKRNSDEL